MTRRRLIAPGAAVAYQQLSRVEDRFSADCVTIGVKIEATEGYVLRPTYHLEMNNAQGSADRIDFEGEDRETVYDGSYSSCEGLSFRLRDSGTSIVKTGVPYIRSQISAHLM